MTLSIIKGKKCRVIIFFITLSFLSCAPKGIKLPETKPGNVVTHRVLPGESWESLSIVYYGTKKKAELLARFNGMDPEKRPEPGVGIRIPLSSSDLRYLNRKARAIEKYNEGLELASKRRFSQAVKKFDEALKLDSTLNDAVFNKAVCYQKLGFYSKASEILTSLVASVDNNEKYLFALGNSQFHLKEYGEAVETFQKVLEMNPSHLKALYSLAVTYEKLKRMDDAEKTWKNYLEMDSTSEWADSARRHLEALREGGGDKN